MIRVEVEQGEVRPYRNTNLCQEVLSMRLPQTQAGEQVLGNTFIDGAHMVLAGLPGDNCVFCTRILKLMSICVLLCQMSMRSHIPVSPQREALHTQVLSGNPQLLV